MHQLLSRRNVGLGSGPRLAECVAIQALRIRELDGRSMLPTPNREIQQEVAFSNDGQRREPPAAFAKRAELLLLTDTDLSLDRIQILIGLARFLRSVMLVLTIPAGFALAGSLLPRRDSDAAEVNVAETFLVFLVVQWVALSLSVILVFPKKWRWRWAPKTATAPILRQIIAQINRLPLDRIARKTSIESISSLVAKHNVLPELLRWAFAKSSALNYIAATWHLFWVFLGGFVTLLLLYQMSVERYDFTWRTTILDDSHIATVIAGLGGPLRRWVEVPDQADIDWLLSDPDQRKSQGGKDGAAHAKKWGRFLPAVLVCWCVLPRTFFWLLMRWRASRWRDDFFPSRWDSDEYFSNVSMMIREYAEPIIVDVPPPVENSTLDHDEEIACVGNGTDAGGSVFGSAIAARTDAIDDGRSPLALGNAWAVVFSHGVQPPQQGWAFLLENVKDAQVKDFGMLNTVTVADRWFSENGPVSRLVALFDLNRVPTATVDLLFQSMSPSVAESLKYAVLTNGGSMRRKYGNDESKIAERVGLWRRHLAKAPTAIPHERVLDFYDHMEETASSRQELQDRLAGVDPRSFSVTGKFPQAATLIRQGVGRWLSVPDAPRRRDCAKRLAAELRGLYAAEAKRWNLSVQGVLSWPECSKCLQEAEQAIAHAGQSMAQSTKASLKTWIGEVKSLRDYFSGWSTEWTAVAALTGAILAPIALPAVAGIPTAIAGLFVGAGSQLAARRLILKAWSAFHGRRDMVAPSEDDLDGGDIELPDFIRSLLLLALVLELQGLPQEQLAAILQALLAGIEGMPLANERDAAQVLHEVETRLLKIAKPERSWT